MERGNGSAIPTGSTTHFATKTVMAWANGHSYCTPDGNIGNDSYLYSVDQCTTVIGATFPGNSCADIPPYGAHYFATAVPSCDGPKVTHIYARGAQIPNLMPTWSMTASGCTANPIGPAMPAGDFMTELAPTEFVEVTRETETTAGRLSPNVYRSADGLVAPIQSAYDVTLASDVVLGTGFASPTQMATWSTTCSEPDASSSCPAPRFDQCTSNTVCSLGAVDPSCNPGPGLTAYQQGPAVSLATLVRGYGTTTGHRLEPIVWTGDALVYQEYPGLYDSSRSIECSVSQIGTGYRCLGNVPQGSYCSDLPTLYTDSACSQPVVFCHTIDPRDSAWHAELRTPPPNPGYQSPEFQVFAVSAAAHSGNLWVKTSTQCEPASWDYIPADKFHDLSLILSSSDFESMTRVIDP